MLVPVAGEFLPLEAVQGDEDYCLYSPTRGLLSRHILAINAIRSFALVASGDPKTDARIYKREADGWRML
jgi:hypothetical protein